ncbi:Probable WRKY transcription factor 2 [Linum perenne]
MAGLDDNVAMMRDWLPPTPSPRAFFSTILGDEMSTRPNSDHQPGETRMDGGLFFGTRQLMAAGNAASRDAAAHSDTVSQVTDSSPFAGHSTTVIPRGGLVERRAGFNVPKLNTERSTDLSLNPDIRSPYLTIPPGLSPTSLLDSPVFVNSLAQPSPTTGKFSFFPNGNSKSSSLMSKDNFFEDFNSSFAFKTVPEMNSSFLTCPPTKVAPVTTQQQSFPSIEVSMQPETSLQSHAHNKQSLHFASDLSNNSDKENYGKAIADDAVAGGNAAHSPPLDDHDEEGDRGDSSIAGAAPADDGYNWRKYGQKQVKGSEYPRSYYKCTHQSCLVKKKVERSHEGHITEIIYKGAHNHPKPPPSRRAAIGSSYSLMDMPVETPEQTAAENDQAWAAMHKGPVDNVEVTSSASAAPEFGNLSSSFQAQNRAHFESSEAAVDASSTFSNEEEDDDRATHTSVGCDGEEDELDSKRRKIETFTAADVSGATRAIREPRVVVQTTSEVDILDDGYRWRKYGQKVVKGNPNPRSYYKCTNAGCTVRKHVERASHDLKSVITTYEGKHNHDVPAARNSSHVGSGASTTTAPPYQAAAAHISRPEVTQVHNSMNRGFDRSAAFGSSFTLPGRQHQLGGPSSNNFSFGMNQPGFANLGMAGLCASGQQPKMPMMASMNPYLAGQQRSYGEMGFMMMPKGEPKMEPVSETGLNLANNQAMYQQIMSRMPHM